MAESAALLVDDVLPHEPIRQWVFSFPFQLRFLFASYPHIMGKVLGIGYWVLCIAHLPSISLKKQATTNGCGHTDPTIWFSVEFKYPFLYALPRWCICRR
jgi:hypothetical protein